MCCHEIIEYKSGKVRNLQQVKKNQACFISFIKCASCAQVSQFLVNILSGSRMKNLGLPKNCFFLVLIILMIHILCLTVDISLK